MKRAIFFLFLFLIPFTLAHAGEEDVYTGVSESGQVSLNPIEHLRHGAWGYGLLFSVLWLGLAAAAIIILLPILMRLFDFSH